MEKLQGYFDLPEVKAVLPPNLLLRWSFKPIGKNSPFFMLYGVKASRDGLPALPGDAVTSARKQVSQSGEIGVSMTMSPEGANDWRRITAQAAPYIQPQRFVMKLQMVCLKFREDLITAKQKI
jgi:SecD/SecF fusion protein